MNIKRIFGYIFSQGWFQLVITLLLLASIAVGGMKYFVDSTQAKLTAVETAQGTPAPDTRDETIRFLMAQVAQLEADKRLETAALLKEQKVSRAQQLTIQQLTIEKGELSNQLKVQEFMIRVLTKENKEMGAIYNEVFN